MTAIPAKLYEAFEKIRLGKVEEGTRLFDRIDGFDVPKSVALAELSYFRHDWKRGILFAQEFFEANFQIDLNRYHYPPYSAQHFQVLLLATCQHNCWKESRAFMEKIKKQMETMFDKKVQPYNVYTIKEIISLISDPVNTTRRLKESKPKQKMEGEYDLDYLEREIKRAVSKRKHWRQSSYDDFANTAFDKTSTADHLVFYEQYTDRLEDARSHGAAAKSYIALGREKEAEEAIRRYMRYWKFKEPFQIAPIVLFTDPELWQVMSDKRFCESLLTIPHNRES